MAPRSSTLAWRIPWTEEPGGLQATGLRRVGHDRAHRQEQEHIDPVLQKLLEGTGLLWFIKQQSYTQELNPRLAVNMTEAVVSIFHYDTLQGKHTQTWCGTPRSLERGKTICLQAPR